MTDWLGPEEWQAVLLSLKVSFWATLLSLPLGVFAAYALARWQFPGKQLVNGLVHLPLVLPPVVTGYLLLSAFGSTSWLGGLLESIGLPLAFRWTGAALAAAVMAFPLMVRAIRLSLEAVDPGLEEAAATLGASRPWIFATVTFPLILPGVFAGIILPSAVYAFLQVPGGESAAGRLVIIAIIIAMGALILSEVMARRIAKRVGGT